MIEGIRSILADLFSGGIKTAKIRALTDQLAECQVRCSELDTRLAHATARLAEVTAQLQDCQLDLDFRDDPNEREKQILQYLYTKLSSSAVHISRATGIERPDVRALVARLAERGLVAKSIGKPDAYSGQDLVRVEILDAGRAIVAKWRGI